MQDFDYVIIGGGCAGLSLAYSLEVNHKLRGKSLAIIEPREKYERDKSWSFWKTFEHGFDDCVKKSWTQFEIKTEKGTKSHSSSRYPYQCIDSGLFYEKILNTLKKNTNISFFKHKKDIGKNSSIIFNSVSDKQENNGDLWQHFQGYEIEVERDIFDDKILTLMDFNCDQKDSVHFFYLLPFSPKTALIETTWISRMDDARELNYSDQIHDYIKDVLKIGEYKINYSEIGKIPMFNTKNTKGDNIIQIGTAGGMTRLSTGYTFINIQKQSSYIQKNIQSMNKLNNFSIRKKYQHLDNIFLSVLSNNSSKMIEVFYRMFGCKTDTIIRFLSEESTFSEDLAVIRSMPKKIFLSALVGK